MHLRTTLSRFARSAVVALCALPLVTVVATAPAAEAASVPSLHAPYFGKSIEPLANYVEQNSCQPGFRKGTAALAHLLVATYPNTTAGGPRNCDASAASEHYDGRAVDWMNSMRVPVQFMQAASVIKFLLATDAYGNKFAMARRMGIMYIIWDNHIWGTWSGTWEDYNGCTKTPSPSLDNACHRNHMHFSMSWDGALGLTSLWSRKVDHHHRLRPVPAEGSELGGRLRRLPQRAVPELPDGGRAGRLLGGDGGAGRATPAPRCSPAWAVSRCWPSSERSTSRSPGATTR